ncbi:MAG: alpha/beta hydrolase [Desulfurivibrionaceae bacterium]|jgi:alpha-beta hydrolase superfamily lysophospholipase|nr:alpha/beta hydrolase [Pseudomonadota bacterium]MCG2822987.1 alpha/beta hydrolase [Desulfobulbaceae bacterium]MDP2002737.1 alpha/beta hydrolase [Desulfurivibrionaceae bacterium]MDP2756298.1 alpha/beta hydrolase [Desulfurivibrionaceae bacterium]PKN16067.1 MAG: alpha/beta hydrolase [Deltaproteobacteria bacterium HGW-Deltaproteobacteria-3]
MEQRRTYEKLDRPEVLAALFYARQETTPTPAGAQDHEIEVEAGVVLGARFFLTDDPAAVNLLFFHGNGEVVSDYDDAGPRYNEQGVNFLAVDYRGYGRSTGTPGVGAMIEDAHRALDWVLAWLAGQGRTGHLVVMGRSLGSVSAIELASSEEAVAGLIVESGIAGTLPLLCTIGIDPQGLGITEADGFGNLQKIARVQKPTYILHAQHDRIIPLTEAEELQSLCGARSKEFQMIPGADHNTILERTGKLYFQAIKQFLNRVGKSHGPRRSGIRG